LDKLVRFEPSWEAEPHDGSLFERLRSYGGNYQAVFHEVVAFLQEKYGYRFELRTVKTSADSALHSANDLQAFLSSSAYHGVPMPVLYLKRTGPGIDGALPPKHHALALVAKGKTKAFFEKLYGLFRANFPGQASLDASDFKRLLQDPALQISQAPDSSSPLGADDLDAVFKAFDSDRSGTVCFNELLVGLSVMFGESLEEKLGLMFASFDANRNETLDADELNCIIRHLQVQLGTSLDFKHKAVALIQEALGPAGGELSEAQFVAVMKKHNYLLGPLWTSGLYVPGLKGEKGDGKSHDSKGKASGKGNGGKDNFGNGWKSGKDRDGKGWNSSKGKGSKGGESWKSWTSGKGNDGKGAKNVKGKGKKSDKRGGDVGWGGGWSGGNGSSGGGNW
jgi:hypothetical protein